MTKKKTLANSFTEVAEVLHIKHNKEKCSTHTVKIEITNRGKSGAKFNSTTSFRLDVEQAQAMVDELNFHINNK